MLQISDAGIVIDELADIHQRLTEGFRKIYGDDINVDADTPDGQMIGLFSQEIANINQMLTFIIQMLDPYQATGTWLEQRALYAGIVRRGAEYSRLPEVVITGCAGATIPAGTVFSDEARGRWVLEETVTLGALGSARTRLRSEILGSFPLQANASLKMETVIVGVDKAVATQAAREGVEEESDAQLLKRFMRSHSVNNYDDRDGIRAALLALPDVQQASVLENYYHDMDPKTGVPGHTFNAIVIGGKDEDIALTLLKKKIGGCGMMGRHRITVDFAGAKREARFDRAALKPVKVRLVIGRLGEYQDIDSEGIKTALASTAFEIGETVYATRLICQVNSVPGFFIKSITVNGGESAPVDLRECATIRPGDVEVLIE